MSEPQRPSEFKQAAIVFTKVTKESRLIINSFGDGDETEDFADGIVGMIRDMWPIVSKDTFVADCERKEQAFAKLIDVANLCIARYPTDKAARIAREALALAPPDPERSER